MRNLIFFIILSFAMSSKAQNKLTIEVNGFNNDKGQLILGICDKEVQFLKEFTYKKIEKITLSKPKCEYSNSYYNSLINRTNKTCSKVIKEIYDVKLKLEDYIETLE